MSKLFPEKIVRLFLTLSAWVSSLTVLLVVVFLFSQGLGLFSSPRVETGYSLCVNKDNGVSSISANDVKNIFDGKIENWAKVGGVEADIETFYLDDIEEYYPVDSLGEEYEHLPKYLSLILRDNPNMIALLPNEYITQDDPNIKVLDEGSFSPSDFFLGEEWVPTAEPIGVFGLLPLFFGTLWLSLLAILIAVPFGLCVAIYLSELAKPKVKFVLKPMIELLSGIPSVVYGFFGLVVLVPLVQDTFNLAVGETLLTGSIILAIMALPTIISLSEEAIRTTPQVLREASLALGANKWQTIYKVVLPYAKNGITAAIILGVGRAIGETMAVLMVTGNAALMPKSILAPVRSIPATIAAELGETPTGSSHYKALFLLACILFLMTLALSITAEFISKKRNK